MKKIIAIIFVLWGLMSCGYTGGENENSISAAKTDTIANSPSVVKGDSIIDIYKRTAEDSMTTANTNPIVDSFSEIKGDSMESFIVKGVSFNMVKVEGGSFMMGCAPNQEAEAFNEEKPSHKVTLNTYYIGQTEVTQALWKAVMGKSVNQIADENGCPTYTYRDEVEDNYPMYYVSWNDVQLFLCNLNSLTDRVFRLPNEAEWEYAARGGNKSKHYKYAGSNDLNEVAWYLENSILTDIHHPVASKQPNELGLYDMSGNVLEWCQDWYDDDYYSQSPSSNPKGPSSSSGRVRRGGSSVCHAQFCRSSYRNYNTPDNRSNVLGFRLLLVP